MIRRLALVVSLTLSACSGPAAVVEPPAPPPPVVVEPVPTGPAFVAVAADQGGVARLDLAWDTSTRVAAAAGTVVARYPTAAGSRVAVLSERGDSLFVGIADAVAGTYRVVHSVPAPARFTTVWSPDANTLVFGHYRPIVRDARPAQGAGDILEVDLATGVKRRVGCSASKAVLAWVSADALLVRDSDNLYVVDRADCRTRSTVDARRMHELTASPDGKHIAYVHRELVYNRQRRAYEPDSTFMMADSDGANQRMVVSFRYRPTRFRWSPDATELAYDVQDPDRPERRQISIFDVATGQNAYLHPPTTNGPSEFDVRWSPDGSKVMFTTQDAGDAPLLSILTAGAPFPWSIPDSGNAEALMWVGNDHVLVRGADGVVRLHAVGMEAFALPAGVDPLAVTAN